MRRQRGKYDLFYVDKYFDRIIGTSLRRSGGKGKILNAYDLPEDTDTIMLKGVVSRKKQLVPTLVSVLQQ